MQTMHFAALRITDPAMRWVQLLKDWTQPRTMTRPRCWGTRTDFGAVRGTKATLAGPCLPPGGLTITFDSVRRCPQEGKINRSLNGTPPPSRLPPSRRQARPTEVRRRPVLPAC